MLHYFVIDYGNTGEFYSIGIDGGTKEQAEEYLQQHSKCVRYQKSLDTTRQYKKSRDLGFGNLFYCKYLPYVPSGLSPDTRETFIGEDAKRGH